MKWGRKLSDSKFILGGDVFNFIQLKQLDRYMIGHKGYVAGGVFKNIFNNEPYKDLDIFFECEADFKEAEKYFKGNSEYGFVYRNKNTVSFRNKETGVRVELIKHSYRAPLEMIKTFDFTITQFVYYKEENDEEVNWKIAYHNKFFEHLHMKRLVIDLDVNEIMLPVNTFNRMFRYAKYGYQPCRETKSKIIQALRRLPNYDDELLSQELYNGVD